MAPIVVTTEVGRPAAEVFAWASDPTRFHEWQAGVVGTRPVPREWAHAA